MNPECAKLPVVETFTSIQGESTHAGRICFFIRLAGCNLSCSYCDTVYAQSRDSAVEYMTVDELLEAAQQSPARLVELTGGEPALQPLAPQLAQRLLEAGFEVLMETNGSVLLDKFPPQLKRIIDVKLPSSNMSQYNEPGNYQLLRKGDELKFVTGSRADFDWALEWIDRWELDKKAVPLIFSAVFGAVEPDELVEWLLQSKRSNLRFQLQMHKFVWPPDMRGV
ncbi:MAG: radical SAM protein [Lentisphaerae bacterium]|nr:radical SAM protein [Lentisphaerota bacterium]